MKRLWTMIPVCFMNNLSFCILPPLTAKIAASFLPPSCFFLFPFFCFCSEVLADGNCLLPRFDYFLTYVQQKIFRECFIFFFFQNFIGTTMRSAQLWLLLRFPSSSSSTPSSSHFPLSRRPLLVFITFPTPAPTSQMSPLKQAVN